jgi:vacuolar protein sorting-associated protein 16
MSLSPQGNMLACFTANGTIWISPPDFRGVCHTFATESRQVPIQMAWCGGDSVVCLWERDDSGFILLMVGPHSQYISYAYYQPVYLISEIDGLRIISESDCEFWQLVPMATVKTLQIGSTEPPAILYDAWRFFEERSPQSDEFVRKIKDDLAVAVQELVEAAGYEFSQHLQRQLLKVSLVLQKARMCNAQTLHFLYLDWKNLSSFFRLLLLENVLWNFIHQIILCKFVKSCEF